MTTATLTSDPGVPRCPAQIAHYRVFELIGAGGMGRVYRAEDTALNRAVALKVLAAHPDDRLATERFLREARALASVPHPNLVTVYQAGADRGVVYLAMELLKGETLEARARRGPLPPREVARIGAQIAAGLGAIHARGLIHRDIKPSNIWLVEPDAGDGRPECDVKILDFGLARSADGTAQLTEVGTVLGTPAYMSPEQARGADLDARTDLFSLGCVLYALATGCPPFGSSNPLSQAVMVATEAHVPAREQNPAVPAALGALIDDLLATDPNERPLTADEVRERLHGARASRRAGLVALWAGCGSSCSGCSRRRCGRARRTRRSSTGTRFDPKSRS
jgi:serine/threonine protein kinase